MANANEPSPAEVLQTLIDVNNYLSRPPWEREGGEELSKRVEDVIERATGRPA